MRAAGGHFIEIAYLTRCTAMLNTEGETLANEPGPRAAVATCEEEAGSWGAAAATREEEAGSWVVAAATWREAAMPSGQ